MAKKATRKKTATLTPKRATAHMRSRQSGTDLRNVVTRRTASAKPAISAQKVLTKIDPLGGLELRLVADTVSVAPTTSLHSKIDTDSRIRALHVSQAFASLLLNGVPMKRARKILRTSVENYDQHERIISEMEERDGRPKDIFIDTSTGKAYCAEPRSRAGDSIKWKRAKRFDIKRDKKPKAGKKLKKAV